MCGLVFTRLFTSMFALLTVVNCYLKVILTEVIEYRQLTHSLAFLGVAVNLYDGKLMIKVELSWTEIIMWVMICVSKRREVWLTHSSIPGACLVNRSPVPAMDLKSNTQACDVKS